MDVYEKEKYSWNTCLEMKSSYALDQRLLMWISTKNTQSCSRIKFEQCFDKVDTYRQPRTFSCE